MAGFGSALDPVLFHGGLALTKAGLVVLGALGFSLLLRNGPAAARHALWTATLVVLFFIPVLSFLPGSFPSIPVSSLGTVQGSALETNSGFEPAAGFALNWSRGPWLLTLWSLGMSGFLLPLLVGLVRGRRMIVKSLPLDTPRWTSAIERAKRRVGLRRSVATLLSPVASTAMAGGIVRPVVILPGDAPAWGSERLDLVLLHELVHVKRGDPARQLLGRLVLALYWFHPLVWMAVRKAGAAREEACDERVIELGQRPSVYARHLLELTSSPSRALAGMTGFHHPDLEARLMAILKPRPRSRRPFAAFAIVAVGLVWMGLVATLGPASAESPSGDVAIPGFEGVHAVVSSPPNPDFPSRIGAPTETRLRGEIAPTRGEGARLQGEAARVRGDEASPAQPRGQLDPTPVRVQVAGVAEQLGHDGGDLVRAVVRSPATVDQTGVAVLLEAAPPVLQLTP